MATHANSKPADPINCPICTDGGFLVYHNDKNRLVCRDCGWQAPKDIQGLN